jgi:hypothetical protein
VRAALRVTLVPGVASSTPSGVPEVPSSRVPPPLIFTLMPLLARTAPLVTIMVAPEAMVNVRGPLVMEAVAAALPLEKLTDGAEV